MNRGVCGKLLDPHSIYTEPAGRSGFKQTTLMRDRVNSVITWVYQN